MDAIKKGRRYRMPTGIIATAVEAAVPGMIGELAGPGGWGRWGIGAGGEVYRLGSPVRKRCTLFETDWTVSDLEPLEE